MRLTKINLGQVHLELIHGVLNLIWLLLISSSDWSHLMLLSPCHWGRLCGSFDLIEGSTLYLFRVQGTLGNGPQKDLEDEWFDGAVLCSCVWTTQQTLLWTCWEYGGWASSWGGFLERPLADFGRILWPPLWQSSWQPDNRFRCPWPPSWGEMMVMAATEFCGLTGIGAPWPCQSFIWTEALRLSLDEIWYAWPFWCWVSKTWVLRPRADLGLKIVVLQFPLSSLLPVRLWSIKVTGHNEDMKIRWESDMAFGPVFHTDLRHNQESRRHLSFCFDPQNNGFKQWHTDKWHTDKCTHKTSAITRCCTLCGAILTI